MAETNETTSTNEDKDSWKKQEQEQILERARGTTYAQRLEWLESAIQFVQKYKGVAKKKNP